MLLHFPIHLVLEAAVSQLILQVYSWWFEISRNDVNLHRLESWAESNGLTFIIITLGALYCDSLSYWCRWILVDLYLLQIDKSPVVGRALEVKFHFTLWMLLLHSKLDLIIFVLFIKVVHIVVLLLHLEGRRVFFECWWLQFARRIRLTFQSLCTWRSFFLVRRRWVRLYGAWATQQLFRSLKHLLELYFWDF